MFFRNAAPAARHWTVSSANCYFRNLNCAGCIHHEYCQRAKYAMRLAVRRLILERGIGAIWEDVMEIKHDLIDKRKLEDIILSDE